MDKKDIMYVTISMPDGSLFRVPVDPSKSLKEQIDVVRKNWYQKSIDNPEVMGHFEPFRETCPKCGSILRGKFLPKGDVIWCTNYKCEYHINEDSNKARERIYEKHGLRPTYVKKTGAFVIMSARPKRK